MSFSLAYLESCVGNDSNKLIANVVQSVQSCATVATWDREPVLSPLDKRASLELCDIADQYVTSVNQDSMRNKITVLQNDCGPDNDQACRGLQMLQING